MMNEELITGLRHLAHTMERNGLSYHQHVAEDAIKALEQQPCEDCISRQKALDCFEQTNTRQGAKYAIETLPSVIPQTVTEFADKCKECGKMLNDKLQLCEDAVSRTLVHEAITASIAESENPYEMWQRIEALPSVKPKYTDEEIDKAQAVEQAYVDKMVELAVEEAKRPKGKWIFHKPFDDGHKNCNECIECNQCHTWLGYDCYAKTPYCPNCGAEMSGGGEDGAETR